jgi:uridine kinase
MHMQSKPYVVGIAGGTCSGKSTLSDRLEEALKNDYKVIVFHMDKYFKRPSPTSIAPITRIEYVEHNHPDSIDLDLLYTDFFTAVEDRSENMADIILIEGLFSLYLDKIRNVLDLKVFVDLKSDERIVRRIKKFMQWGQTMEEITNRYLDTVRYRHDELIEPSRWHADIVINGTLDAYMGTDVLLKYLKVRLLTAVPAERLLS